MSGESPVVLSVRCGSAVRRLLERWSGSGDGEDTDGRRSRSVRFLRLTSIAQTSSVVSQRGLDSLRPVKLLRQLQTLKTTIASTTISRILRNPIRSWHSRSIPSINSTPTEARHRRATCSTASSTRPGWSNHRVGHSVCRPGEAGGEAEVAGEAAGEAEAEVVADTPQLAA